MLNKHFLSLSHEVLTIMITADVSNTGLERERNFSENEVTQQKFSNWKDQVRVPMNDVPGLVEHLKNGTYQLT